MSSASPGVDFDPRCNRPLNRDAAKAAAGVIAKVESEGRYVTALRFHPIALDGYGPDEPLRMWGVPVIFDRTLTGFDPVPEVAA